MAEGFQFLIPWFSDSNSREILDMCFGGPQDYSRFDGSLELTAKIYYSKRMQSKISKGKNHKE